MKNIFDEMNLRLFCFREVIFSVYIFPCMYVYVYASIRMRSKYRV